MGFLVLKSYFGPTTPPDKNFLSSTDEWSLASERHIGLLVEWLKPRLCKRAVRGSRLLTRVVKKEDIMNNFNTSFLLVLFTLGLLTSCSYEFAEPPFQRSELIEISKTEFGKELLSA